MRARGSRRRTPAQHGQCSIHSLRAEHNSRASCRVRLSSGATRHGLENAAEERPCWATVRGGCWRRPSRRRSRSTWRSALISSGRTGSGWRSATAFCRRGRSRRPWGMSPCTSPTLGIAGDRVVGLGVPPFCGQADNSAAAAKRSEHLLGQDRLDSAGCGCRVYGEHTLVKHNDCGGTCGCAAVRGPSPVVSVYLPGSCRETGQNR